MDRATALEKQIDMLQQSHAAELRIAQLEKQIAEEKSTKAIAHIDKVVALMDRQKEALEAKTAEAAAVRTQLSEQQALITETTRTLQEASKRSSMLNKRTRELEKMAASRGEEAAEALRLCARLQTRNTKVERLCRELQGRAARHRQQVQIQNPPHAHIELSTSGRGGGESAAPVSSVDSDGSDAVKALPEEKGPSPAGSRAEPQKPHPASRAVDTGGSEGNGEVDGPDRQATRGRAGTACPPPGDPVMETENGRTPPDLLSGAQSPLAAQGGERKEHDHEQDQVDVVVGELD